jgi:hypothetical protein
MSLNRGGFSAEYRSPNSLRIEWGHAHLSSSFTSSQLQPLAGERASTTVDEALHSSLCRKVVRTAHHSRYFDATLTKLAPEDILARARANVEIERPAVPSAGAQAVQRAVAKLTQGETGSSLSRLSSAAKQVEVEASLNELESEISGQRDKDDSLHAIDALFGDINTSAKSRGENPLDALEVELKKGPTHRQLREVEALIEEVDMAATPNTRRKNQIARKTAKDEAQKKKAVDAELPAGNRLELTQEALSRTSKAKQLSEETFEKETRRLAKAEEARAAEGTSRVEQEQQELVRAADEAERAVEEASRSQFVSNTNAVVEVPTMSITPYEEDSRVVRAQAEARDRALKEAALAEEQRNLRELKAAQMEALARQREVEEREAAEQRAELELIERAKEEEERVRIEKERAALAEQLKAQEAKLAVLQAEQERNALANVEAARRAEVAEKERRKHELEALQKQSVAASVLSFPDDAAFTPIATSKGVGKDLETPLTLAIKDEMNLDAMLGQLDFDLDVPRDNASVAAPTNTNLASVAKADLSRNSAAVRDLDNLDDLMAGMDGFSFDTSSIAASTVAAPKASSGLDNSRTGGLKINEPVRSEELDVEAALGSMDFNAVTNTSGSEDKHRPPHHDFSVVVPHNTAVEVVEASTVITGRVAPAGPTHNAFDDFKLDTIDTSGAAISASLLHVEVNLDAIGASPAKAAEAVAKVEAEKKASEDAEKDRVAAVAAANKEVAKPKEAEVIQDDKSKAGFGDKKAMFESGQQAPQQQQPAKNDAKRSKNKKKTANKKKK